MSPFHSLLPFLLLLLTTLTTTTTTSTHDPSRIHPSCLTSASVIPGDIWPPLFADCIALATALRAIPGAAARYNFTQYPEFRDPVRTCQAAGSGADSSASFEEIAEVVEQVARDCLTDLSYRFVGGSMNIGEQNDEHYFWVSVTGIWDPWASPLRRVGDGNVGNGNGTEDGRVGRVDVT